MPCVGALRSVNSPETNHTKTQSEVVSAQTEKKSTYVCKVKGPKFWGPEPLTLD